MNIEINSNSNKLKNNSITKNYLKFFNSNYNKSISKEKLYLNNPKNFNTNSNYNYTSKDRHIKSPNLKLTSKGDSQGKIYFIDIGNRPININHIEKHSKQQINTTAYYNKVNHNEGNLHLISNVNSAKNILSPNIRQYENNNINNNLNNFNNNFNTGKFQTDTNKMNIMMNINSEFINDNIKINSPQKSSLKQENVPKTTIKNSSKHLQKAKNNSLFKDGVKAF